MSRRTRLSVRLLLLVTLVVPFVATAPAAANPDGPEVYWVDESADRVVQSVDPASLRDRARR